MVSGPIGTLPFQGADEIYMMVRVDDLEPSEQVIVRFDTWLICDPGSHPTGSLKAVINEARLAEAEGYPIVPPVDIPTGTMAIPMGQLGQLNEP